MVLGARKYTGVRFVEFGLILLLYTIFIGLRQGAPLTDSTSGWGYPLVASSPYLYIYYTHNSARLYSN